MNESKPYMNKYKAYTDAANDPHFTQESKSMNPPNKHISQVDPMWEVTSKYYIDRLWEEYHKMKEELADTKSKLAQAEDEIDIWKKHWVTANAENIKLRASTERQEYKHIEETWEDVRARCS